MPTPPSPDVLHHERLSVPLRWWVQGTMLVASAFLAVVVALPFLGALIVTTVVAGVVYGGMVWWGSAVVEVRRSGSNDGTGGNDGAAELVAGRGRLPLAVVVGVEELDTERTRAVLGREADARAYLVYRGWLKESVRVRLADPADPTPYWLVSTRHPARLAASLARARQTPGHDPAA